MGISEESSGEIVQSLIQVTDDASKPQPLRSPTTGGWRSAFFIIGVEVAERFAYYGISSNLITFLTGPMGQSTATAAANVNAWSGAASLLPLLGAFIADSFLGRYRTIIAASIIYILGLGLLTLSAVLPSLISDQHSTINDPAASPDPLLVVLFFFSLYLVAFGQGGHKPCVQAFGADQFDSQDPEEAKAKSSFFNWWYFFMCGGTLITLWVLNYIQDNLNWGLGFGIPCVVMAIALVVFVAGTRTYRFSIRKEDNSAFQRILRVFVASIRNRRTTPATADDAEAHGCLLSKSSEQFKFIDKAEIAPDGVVKDGKKCSPDEINEAKALLRLLPIWATCLVYAIVFAQSSTFFTKQGMTMDRSISPGFDIPAATLQSFISLSVVLTLPFYDRVFVPVMRIITGIPSGITMLQRIGIGITMSILSMVIAAIVEINRLKTAEEYGLVDTPNATIPMNVWWLIPQYALYGVSDVFTMVGLQEFFYDQVPAELRSVGLSLYLSIFGVGSILSSFLVSGIEKLTGGVGHDSWFSDNLNRAHLDYFYWLLAGLSTVQLVAYLLFSISYVYKKKQ